MTTPATSHLECCILQAMVMRRYCYRKQFLRLKSDPCKHSKESGYVFDPAMQRFISMKCTQLEHFQDNARNAIYAVCTMVIPFFGYGYLIYTSRAKREALIRSGKLRYLERSFKLC